MYIVLLPLLNQGFGSDFPEIQIHIWKAIKDNRFVCDLVCRLYSEDITSKIGCAGFYFYIEKETFPGT